MQALEAGRPRRIAGTARHRRKQRRRGVALTIATYLVAAAIAVAASGGIMALIDIQSGGRLTAMGVPLAGLYTGLFGTTSGAIDGEAAFCRIGDAGTETIGDLEHACRIGERGSLALADLAAPYCAIGDEGSLDLAALAAGGIGNVADLGTTDGGAPAEPDGINAFDSLDPHSGSAARNSHSGQGSGGAPDPSLPGANDPPGDVDPPSHVPGITPTSGGPQFAQRTGPGGGDPGGGGPHIDSFNPFPSIDPGPTFVPPLEPLIDPVSFDLGKPGGHTDPGGGGKDPSGPRPDPPHDPPTDPIQPALASVDPVAVSEPGTLASFAFAALTVFGLGWRRRQAALRA